ncbi:MAG: peptide chain release factor 2 [Patescibacteria group bacterium]|nr:peptide chain release factor 2 [Patescibacteria group bacterium]
MIEKIKELQVKIAEVAVVLNLPQKKQKILELQEEMSNPNFWADNERAGKIAAEASNLSKEVEEMELLKKETADELALALESEAEGNNELAEEIEKKYEELKNKFSAIEFDAMMNGPHDNKNAVVAVHAGTGGTDAQDWAEMLERMLFRYAEKKKFKVTILDRQMGNEAGIKSSIFEVAGPHAFGYLKSEAGVHRLVRISPFDAEKMRHTSFALVEVLPMFEEAGEIEIKDDDLEIDVFRSSGHGGQSVNTTDSAVRIRHKPTGIIVTCQNERSQMQNKQTAMRVLLSRLKQYYDTKEEEEKKKLRGEFTEAVWGNQAISYVLQPYKMVKDHRTGYETVEVEKVLNGELEELVEAFLKKV